MLSASLLDKGILINLIYLSSPLPYIVLGDSTFQVAVDETEGGILVEEPDQSRSLISNFPRKAKLDSRSCNVRKLKGLRSPSKESNVRSNKALADDVHKGILRMIVLVQLD